MNIIERLPDIRGPERGDEVPNELIGATIIRIGTLPAEANVGGGGLVIEYHSRDGHMPRRIVFGFNELGMWVETKPNAITDADSTAD